MTSRRVIFVPDDYWTNPPEETTTMTDYSEAPKARDIRLAAALTIHHRTGSTAGMHEIVRDTTETCRASELLMSVLDLHTVFIVQSRTPTGVDYLGTFVQNITTITPTDLNSLDRQRACRVLDAHGRNDWDTINDVIRAASPDNRCTQMLLELLNLYAELLPELSSTAGREWLDHCVRATLNEEGNNP